MTGASGVAVIGPTGSNGPTGAAGAVTGATGAASNTIYTADIVLIGGGGGGVRSLENTQYAYAGAAGSTIMGSRSLVKGVLYTVIVGQGGEAQVPASRVVGSVGKPSMFYGPGQFDIAYGALPAFGAINYKSGSNISYSGAWRNFNQGVGGGAGTGSSTFSFNGGDGLTTTLTNPPFSFGGGGAGTSQSVYGTASSNGGEGGQSALNGFGGGAGSIRGAAAATTGCAGGSGFVLLSIPTINYSNVVTGNPTISINGLNTVLKFTSSGTILG